MLSLSLSLSFRVCVLLFIVFGARMSTWILWRLIDWLTTLHGCVCFLLYSNRQLCASETHLFLSPSLLISLYFFLLRPSYSALSLYSSLFVTLDPPPLPKKKHTSKMTTTTTNHPEKKKMHNIPIYLKSHFKNYYFLFIWKLNFPSLRLIFVQSGVVLRLRLVLQKVFTNKGKHLLFFFLHLICTSPFRFDFFQIKRENRIIRFRLLFDFFFLVM